MLRLVIFCSVLVTVAGAEICFKDGKVVTAISIIQRNLKPPRGAETSVRGTVRMMQTVLGGPTFIKVELSGFPPGTLHGFHIHEFGDIITKGCQSCGGHYNPYNQTHGGHSDKIRHVGDLGNLLSSKRGTITMDIEDDFVSLVGPHSVIGRSFVIHQRRDDLGRGTGTAREESLKTGNAGARVGCGVIIHAPVNE